MNAFNCQQMELDERGLTESCDACNRLILNWDSVGDAAILATDGAKILCHCCLDKAARRCDLTP